MKYTEFGVYQDFLPNLPAQDQCQPARVGFHFSRHLDIWIEGKLSKNALVPGPRAVRNFVMAAS